ncbi:hypothetical protein SAMN05421770_10982 [Granulicella rosea]|uniref:Uncharacterized protein n=1 Tax=Granulicella rosea TaxID=474952 RepID=A0A239M567_9BACT|nr:hypothetical protein SAMN05421770_10982 [Granulicella rosea]
MPRKDARGRLAPTRTNPQKAKPLAGRRAPGSIPSGGWDRAPSRLCQPTSRILADARDRPLVLAASLPPADLSSIRSPSHSPSNREDGWHKASKTNANELLTNKSFRTDWTISASRPLACLRSPQAPRETRPAARGWLARHAVECTIHRAFQTKAREVRWQKRLSRRDCASSPVHFSLGRTIERFRGTAQRGRLAHPRGALAARETLAGAPARGPHPRSERCAGRVREVRWQRSMANFLLLN